MEKVMLICLGILMLVLFVGIQSDSQDEEKRNSGGINPGIDFSDDSDDDDSDDDFDFDFDFDGD